VASRWRSAAEVRLVPTRPQTSATTDRLVHPPNRGEGQTGHHGPQAATVELMGSVLEGSGEHQPQVFPVFIQMLGECLGFATAETKAGSSRL
jgi:hypothetical protein